MVEAHCYAYNRGGINNQKIALFDLYLMSLHRFIPPRPRPTRRSVT